MFLSDFEGEEERTYVFRLRVDGFIFSGVVYCYSWGAGRVSWAGIEFGVFFFVGTR